MVEHAIVFLYGLIAKNNLPITPVIVSVIPVIRLCSDSKNAVSGVLQTYSSFKQMAMDTMDIAIASFCPSHPNQPTILGFELIYP